MNGNYDLPVSFGNPEEYFVKNFAQYIQKLAESKSEIVFLLKSHDDSSQQWTDIATTKRELGWHPVVSVEQRLEKRIFYFQHILKEAGEIIVTGPSGAKPESPSKTSVTFLYNEHTD